jgi:predicted nucleotidyltransferase component of viral defense system
MPKLVFTQAQQLDLTQRLQLLLIESLAAQGSWGSMKFQGGTSLSLVYGSSRFSEDLDFLVGTDRGLARLVSGAQTRMTNSLRATLPGTKVSYTARDADIEAEDAKNPRSFTMTVANDQWYRSIKVKVEFWVANPEAVAQYQVGVKTARILNQVVEGNPLRLTMSPVMVPAATLQEIVVDKLHALACRQYLKHRDLFDLWWLAQQGVQRWDHELVSRYPYHAKMYNDSPALADLLVAIERRCHEVQAQVGRPEFKCELQRWLGEDSAFANQDAADAILRDVTDRVQAMVASVRQLTLAADVDGPSPTRTRPKVRKPT